jgi:signal transduction histidine kinase
VMLTVTGDGHGEIHELTDITDRIGAAGGSLNVTCKPDAGTIATVVIPCEL